MNYLAEKFRKADVDGPILKRLVDVDVMIKYVGLTLGEAVKISLAVVMTFHKHRSKAELDSLNLKEMVLSYAVEEEERQLKELGKKTVEEERNINVGKVGPILSDDIHRV